MIIESRFNYKKPDLKIKFMKEGILFVFLIITSFQMEIFSQENYLGNEIISDKYGNTYVAGNFRNSSLRFGSCSLNNKGGNDIFVAKYDSHGKIVWAKSISGKNDEKILSIKIGYDGNILISGSSNSKKLSIDSDSLINPSEIIFNADLNLDGDLTSAHIEKVIKSKGTGNYPGSENNLYKVSENDTTISLLSPKEGDNWIVGAKGTIEWSSQNVSSVLIELSTDNGATWQKIYRSSLFELNNQYNIIVPNTPSDSCLVRVSDYYNLQISDTSNLFSISGTLYWDVKQSGYNSVLKSVAFLNSSVGWAAGFNGLIETTDKGESWTPKLEGYGLQDIYFLNNNTGWTVGLSGIIFKTTDGGNNWTQLQDTLSFHFEKVFFADENNGYMIGKGCLLKTTDGGVSWIIKQPTDHILQTMYFMNKDTGWVAGNEGVILKTTDAGTTWQHQQMNGTNYGTLTSLFFTDENTGWVSGSGLDIAGGVILKTINSGDNWCLQHNGSNTFIYSVCFTNEFSGWAAGDGGIMFNTTDGGSHWELQGSGTFADLYSIKIKSSDNGWAVGNDGTILKYIKASDSSVLPVDLTSFNAYLNMNKVELKWQTGSEINNKGFELERRTSNDWKAIAFIKGKGTTAERNKYLYADDLKNLNYQGRVGYRLKQIDFDGSYKYSDEVSVNLNLSPVEYSLMQNYPNPFNPSTLIKYTLKDNVHVSLKVYDILGREVAVLADEEKPSGTYTVNFNPGNQGFSSGTYLYVLKAGDFVQARKMIFLK
jgi:photosystem II stability/assembly factor-like uncharacterized protein